MIDDYYDVQARAPVQARLPEEGDLSQPVQPSFTPDRYAQEPRVPRQYPPHQHPQQQGTAAHPPVLQGHSAKTQDVRVQCEAADCQALLQVHNAFRQPWPLFVAAERIRIAVHKPALAVFRGQLTVRQRAAQVSIPITQQLRSPVIVRCGGCNRYVSIIWTAIRSNRLVLCLAKIFKYLPQRSTSSTEQSSVTKSRARPSK